MTEKEYKVYLQTRLRNLKRKHAKLIQHPDLIDEAIEIDREIQPIKETLARM